MAKLGTAEAVYSSAPLKTIKRKEAAEVVFTPISEKERKNRLNEKVISEFSPFPQGTITPTKLNNQISQGIKNIESQKKYIKPIVDKNLLSVNIGDTESEINNLENLKSKAVPIFDSYKQKSFGARGDQLARVNEARDNEMRKITGGYTFDELNALIDEKKRIKKQAERTQKLKKLLSVVNPESDNYDKDFEKYKQSGNQTDYKTVGKDNTTTFQSEHFSKKDYRITNDRAAAIALAEHNGMDKNATGGDNYDNVKLYRNFTNDEFDLLAYYFGRDKATGGNEVQEYLDLMEETLNMRAGSKIYEEKLKDKTGLEILYGVPVGLDQFSSGMTNLLNTEDDYIPVSPTQIAGQLAREDLGEVKLPEWLGGFSLAQVGYDVVSTTANMAPSILTSMVAEAVLPGSGSWVGGALMGASAAGNAYQQALNDGMDKTQARTYSTLVGISEAALSAVLSKAVGGKALDGKIKSAINSIDSKLLKFAANYGAAFASEGFEEGLQEVLTPLFENIALGYNKNGFEDIDWGEVVYSTLLGGLSGGMFEVAQNVPNAINYIQNISVVKNTYNSGLAVANLIDLGLSLPEGTKANTYAQQLNETVNKGKKVSSNKLYNLVISTENVIADRLNQLGETQNVSQVANAIVKKLSGVELSTNEIELLSKSSYGQEVLKTTVPQTVETKAQAQENEIAADMGAENAVTNTDGERGLGFTEPTNQEIYREPTAEENAEAIFGKRKTAKQRHILDVAKKLDSNMKVVFVDKNSKTLNGKNGKYNRGTNTMYIAKDLETNDIKLVEAYVEVFKHEFVHRLELRKAYDSFKNYLFKKSLAFEKYANARLFYETKVDTERTRDEAINGLINMYMKNSKGDLNLTREQAEREVVADFVARTLFKDKSKDFLQAIEDKNIYDKENGTGFAQMETDLELFEEMAKTDRNLLQKIIDAIKDLIASIKGYTKLEKDLQYLEERLARVYESADSKKSATESGEVYQNANDNILQKNKSNDIINNQESGVEKDERIYNQGTMDGSDKTISTRDANSESKREVIRFRPEDEITFKRRIEATFRGKQQRVDTGKTTMVYVVGNPNPTSNSGKAYNILKNNGINVVYCQGSIYRNNGKTTTETTEAVTAPDGTVYISSNATLPGIEIALHEIVHVAQSTNNQAFVEYESLINDNIIRVSNTYLKIAEMINKNNFGGTLDVESFDSGSRIMRELSAYINQFVITDPTFAERTFGGMFEDWGAVVEAVNKFNTDIKADFTESANFMPDNESFSSDDLSALQRDLYNRHKNGEITNEEYLEETDKLWGKANETYGMLPQGENAKAPIATPKAVAEDKPTERFTRTIIETDTLKAEMLQGMEEKVLLGDFAYEVMSDESAIKTANKAIENKTANAIWEDVVSDGKRINKNKIAIGEQLLTNAIKEGETFKVLKLSAELADIFTRAGQVVQAARLLKKMTGAGRLVSLQRTVKTINKDLVKKYGEDYPPIKISEESAQRLADAKTAGGIEYAYQEILQEVADQVPSTFLDKWNAWRYFAMLSNPKTHIRNLIGNGFFLPFVRIKDGIAQIMELGVDQSKKTKSFIVKPEYRDFAKKDSKNQGVKNLLKGNKYNDKSAIKEKQKIFKTEVLNFLTEFNSNALEAEDMFFKNKHYIHALGSFLQARKVDLSNVSEEMLWEARTYAVKEAKKATFNDESALANWLQSLGKANLAGNLIVEGILPFKRTPINIVKRGIEYSPIGLANAIKQGLFDVKKGKITVTEFVDGLAAGMTGTLLMAAGMFVANMGWVSGGEKDDKESKFEKFLGKQEYSVKILGKSYTIDWAAPANIPFFIGVEIVNSANSGEDFSLASFINATWNSLEPITNLSMLSGMQSVIESARYAEPAQTFSSIGIDALTTYAMQGVPSLFGATARTIDPTQRSWYIDKNNKWLDNTAQTVKNNIQSKVPGLSYTQIPKIDMWGREVSRGGTAERVLENFVSPGYYSEIEVTETSEELKRIFNKTDIDVFPNIAAKSFELDGKTKHLTAAEYVTYAKAKGTYSYDYIKEFLEASSYERLTDEEKADVIGDLYEYANAKAKTTVSNYDLMKRYKTVTLWERNGRSAVDYYIYKAISK